MAFTKTAASRSGIEGPTALYNMPRRDIKRARAICGNRRGGSDIILLGIACSKMIEARQGDRIRA
jgi:hypothetical protein